MATRLGAFFRSLDEPIDGASVGAFRIGLGLVLAAAFVRVLLRGFVDTLYVGPTYFFTYPGFAWVKPMSPFAMHALVAVLAVAAVVFASGRAFKLAAGVLFVGFTYIELIDRTTYLNHYYFTSIVLMLACLLPFDAALVLASSKDAHVPRFVLFALRVQVGVVYFFAGLAKLRPDWLLHGQPLHLWLSMYDDTPLVGPMLGDPRVALAMSWGGAVFDLSIPFVMSMPRIRPYAYVVIVVFHVLTGLLFPIGMFPFVMVLAATVFFPPDWPRRVLAKLRTRAQGVPRTLPRWVSLFVLVHLVLQIAIPLRRFAYPGDTTFTEDGFRFAWQVMLVEKRGLVTFTVVDARGRRRFVDPKRELRPHQYRQMSTQPDLVLAYAHHLAAVERARVGGPVSVYADAWVTWNGRRSQRFIRPDVDLARIADDLSSATRYTTTPEARDR